ncbi:hypothetical protein FVP74_12430 [Microbacterium saccharophilum]|uniref:Uncharacterized protein n=1 Tax=Microbacterium saccharophilum TaxID=1213358 RepID=A0A5C8HV95_9MICO|nr:hypothetical protein [Microbacterium saccharophilum]TXK08886.1 hypothetical protein FVP74_12430 [Microbacterium saccharophilum]GEP48097.1 hypothetical protein MSA03_16050 [Microbacterium saccharophilum]
MQRLHYTGDSILMADETAAALLDYASALAEANASDVVAVPAVDEEGRSTKAELLIGPASQLYTMPVAGLDEVPPDADVIAELQLRAAKVRPSRPVTEETELSTFVQGDDDLV